LGWREYQVSISSTFHVQMFHMNFVLAAFSSYLLALSKNLYKKHTRITLMKLTTRVNFINIVCAQFFERMCFFLPKSFCQSQYVTREKLREALSYEKRVHVKCWWNWQQYGPMHGPMHGPIHGSCRHTCACEGHNPWNTE